MGYLKIFFLLLCILVVNKCLIKVDYNKFFKKNSTKEIYFFNMILSVILGYLFYQALVGIYSTSLIFKFI